MNLIVLVADTDAEWVVRTLLEYRHRALGIPRLTFKVIRHPMRDNGVYHQAVTILRPYLQQAEYALVLLDREGSGQEHQSAEQIENILETALQENGWRQPDGRSRAGVIVLDPELEIWVWSSSPHVPRILGVSSEQLEAILSRRFPRQANGKPARPKEAMLAVLKESQRPFSARIFQELASRVSLRTKERAFTKFCRLLQQWFT
ncbi:MAG: hypothetical protein D6784_13620 [Chloroflexi bacterium]|nr:MAG: hypothetical protein D6784_13620 [Chloroflexota bacterium]